MTKALFSATLLFGMLLLGTPVAAAAAPTGPPDVATPVAPPEPHPCRPEPLACDATFAPPTDPGTTEPAEPAEPSAPSEPAAAPSESAARAAVAANPSTAGPAESGTGAVSPVSTSAWWLIALPVAALLALAAAGTALLIQRTERRPS